MSTTELADAIAELERQRSIFPADRYPVQHATASFHLGTLMLQSGETERATTFLKTAAELFDPALLSVEHAKATNLLGAALREGEVLDEARGCFERAAALFETADLPLERGAALFNLGLILRDLEDPRASATTFAQARDLLDPKRVPAQAAAAARELGTSLLNVAEPAEATKVLAEAIELAERCGDEAGLGAAANALGLAHLAMDEADEAVASFRSALAANPRSLRPHAAAMAKANLAVAYEKQGHTARARLAALQAAAIPQASEVVVAQATGLLQRLGPDHGDLMTLLEVDDENRDAITREELTRWLDIDEGARRREARTWIRGQVAQEWRGEDIAEAWLRAILELPPGPMEVVIASMLAAAGEVEPKMRTDWHAQVERAMARFYIPQWDRLRSIFNHVALELGQEASWR